MKDYRIDRHWSIIFILFILGAYIVRHFGSDVEGQNLRHILIAFALFFLIGFTIIGIILPFFGSFAANTASRPTVLGILILIVLAIVIFVPLFWDRIAFNLDVYETVFDLVSALGLCIAIWLNHRNFVNHMEQDNDRKKNAFLWAGMGTSMAAVFMLSLRKK